MANSTQDGDEEVFEIVDFTTASDWEVFTSAVEETMQEWHICGDRPKLPVSVPGVLGAQVWKELKQVISYCDFPFELSYHCALPGSITSAQDNEAHHADDCSDNDEDPYSDEADDCRVPSSMRYVHDCDNCFPSRAHCVARWFGLREFIIAAPASTGCSVALSKARLILSALTMAASNTDCRVAVLTQVLRPSDRQYLGTLTAPGIRSDMDMIHIRGAGPGDCRDYDGLVRLLSNKVGIEPYRLSPLASARFTYMITEWPEEACWAQAPPDLDLDLSVGGLGDLGYSGIRQLPFGLLSDPVQELHVSAVWPGLSHGSFEDSSNRCSLDPCTAPLWTAKVLPQTGSSSGPQVAGLLGEHLVEFLSACRDERSVTDLLGHAFGDHGLGGPHFSSALDRLTEHSVPSLGSVLLGTRRLHHAGSARVDNRYEGPLAPDVLVPMLVFLFPVDEDDEERIPPAPYPSSFSRVPAWSGKDGGLPEEHPLKEVSAGIKTCASDGLVWRLSVLCCHAIHSLGGLAAVAHLLYEVVLELRFRWDNCLPVPGLPPAELPDLSSCLLHQKLQMLNCCIARRAHREDRLEHQAVMPEEPDDIDEFFDCMAEDEEESDQEAGPQESVSLSSWDRPEGRLRPCGKLRLLGSRARMYVPVTQEPAPVTEDVLEEQAQVLLRLGDSDEGSSQRARLLSSSLHSDMEAFKAANPGCELCDFVRWYSPRDWVVVGGEAGGLGNEGHLSDRMTLPGNMWQEVWQSAHPVPAHRQKRLFDDTHSAEQCLRWLSHLGPGPLCRELLPVLLHVACCRLAEERAGYTLPSSAVWGASPPPSHSAGGDVGVMPALQHDGEALPALLVVVAQRLGRLARQPCDVIKYREVVEQLIAIEKCIGRALSLRHKLLPGHIEQHKRRLEDADHVSRSAEVWPSNNSANSTKSNCSSASTIPSNCSDNEVLVQLISALLSSGEVEVAGAAEGVAGQALLRLFDRALQYQDQHTSAPYPSLQQRSTLHPSARRSLAECIRTRLGYVGAREYIVRVRAEYPGAASRATPHRLYATLLRDDFRVAGLFTQDTCFT